MAPENRNEFLDAGDSDEDVGRDYDSEDDLQKGGRNAKRRRVNDGSDSEGEDYSDAESEADGGAKLHDDESDAEDDDKKDKDKDQDQKHFAQQQPPQPKKSKKSKKSGEDEEDDEGPLKGVSKPLTKKNLVASEEAIRKSGVAYLSKIPPFMKPAKLRSLLEPYGKINRIFLAPEDPAAHTRRVRAGGNKKRCFTEGWVEFVRKKDCKMAVELLNGRTIGGKKGSYYRDDIWSLLYLKGFKWHHLTEQIAAENAERASRMRAEISKTTKENKEFVANVERAKVLNGIQAKKAAKRKNAGGEEEAGGEEDTAPAAVAGGKAQERRRTFKQIPLAKKRKLDEEQPENVTRVLKSIF